MNVIYLIILQALLLFKTKSFQNVASICTNGMCVIYVCTEKLKPSHYNAWLNFYFWTLQIVLPCWWMDREIVDLFLVDFWAVSFSSLVCNSRKPPYIWSMMLALEDLLPIFKLSQPKKVIHSRGSAEEIHFKESTHHVMMTNSCNKCASVLTYDN